MKRDEWMLMPPSAPTVPGAASSSRAVPARDVDVDMMDGYGDAPADARTMSGGVDFFLKPERELPRTSNNGLRVLGAVKLDVFERLLVGVDDPAVEDEIKVLGVPVLLRRSPDPLGVT